MEALFTTFVAATLAEVGDKTQLLVVALAVRFRAPLPIMAGVAVGALVNSLVAATGGVLIHGFITLRATSLLVALALVFAGVAGFLGQERPKSGESWNKGPFVTTAACFFLLEFADKTQFLTGALAAQYNALFLAAAGASIGVVAANLPAAYLGDQLATTLPMGPIRKVIAALFLLAGFFVAISALRLI